MRLQHGTQALLGQKRRVAAEDEDGVGIPVNFGHGAGDRVPGAELLDLDREAHLTTPGEVVAHLLLLVPHHEDATLDAGGEGGGYGPLYHGRPSDRMHHLDEIRFHPGPHTGCQHYC